MKNETKHTTQNITNQELLDSFEYIVPIQDKQQNHYVIQCPNNDELDIELTEYDMFYECCHTYKTFFNSCINKCIEWNDEFQKYCHVKKLTFFARLSHKSIQ